MLGIRIKYLRIEKAALTLQQYFTTIAICTMNNDGTLGPAYNEFGYNEHLVTTSK